MLAAYGSSSGTVAATSTSTSTFKTRAGRVPDAAPREDDEGKWKVDTSCAAASRRSTGS